MNKLTKLLSIFALSATIGTGVAGLAACDGCNGTAAHKHSYSWVNNGDGTHKEHCGVDGCDAPDKSEGNHVFDADGKCVCGATEEKHSFGGDWKYDFNNHYKECTDEGCNAAGESAPHTFDSKGVCTTCGAKFASYQLIPSELAAQKYPDGLTSGVFSLAKNTEVRTRSRENYSVYDYKNGYYGNSDAEPVETGFTASKSVKLGGSGDAVTVNAIAAGRITVYVDNGSSGKTEKDNQTLVITKPDNSTEQINFCCVGLYAVTIDCATAGNYKIARASGTVDLYYAKYETVVAITPVEKIQIADSGKVSYIKGEEFDSSKLQLQIVRKETGTIEPLDKNAEGVSIDSSAFNKDVAGEYKIVVSYSADGETFEAEYTVRVSEVVDIELGFNMIVKGNNTVAGNGQYVNRTVKQFYFKDEDFSTDGLTVKTVLDADGKEKKIVTEGFTVTGFEKGKSGKQTITVFWTDAPEVKKTFEVFVADYTAASITASQEIKISVNAGIEDARVGVRSNGVFQFKTIQQSIEFLNALTLDKNVKKVISLAEGTYNEKLEITIPNLTIKGADAAHPEKTVIEWNSLVGIEDESGFTHVTDSTATLSVRDTATGFVIEGVTVSNWYNCEEHFNQIFGEGYGEHRALAMLVQADKVVIDNCRLLGYQDTIEFFTGRQHVTNTYVCGRTDFIFGTNNTTYFKDCTIESIVDGGYITAFKGNNKGDSDWVQYGAVFDSCDFIAPEGVVEKANTSLGRTWGKYAAVAYVNCDFAGHICKTAYGTAGAKNTRYTAMSGVTPTEKTVKFIEYNNTGAGAISEQGAGMTLITDAAEGGKYSDLSVIFGTQNGKLLYADAWDGEKGVEITTVDYKFNAEFFVDGDVEIKPEQVTEDGYEIFNGVMTVHGAWHTELSSGDKIKDFGWFDVGTVIIVNEIGKVNVETYGQQYGLPENVKINYANNKAIITIVATENSPITGGCCISLIQIDTKAQAPAHVHTYGEWEIAEMPAEDAGGKAVKVCTYCENTPADSVEQVLPVLSEENYAITAGTSAGKSTYTYTTEGGEKIVFETDALAGLHVHNYGDTWAITATADSAGKATKACTGEGTCDAPVISFDIPALSSGEYTVADNTATLEAAGTGTYSITVDGTEISFTAATPKIELTEINAPVSITFGTGGNYKAQMAENLLYAENSSNAPIRDNESNNSQINAETVITLKVKAGAKITIDSYNGYTNYTVKINGADYNDGAAETGTSWEYSATADSTVQLISGSNNYYYGITITFGLTEINSTSDKKKFESTEGVDTTEFIEFSNVTSHNGGEYWNLGKTGTIKIKVAAGATLTLKCGYWGIGITINGDQQDISTDIITYASVDGGEIIIGCVENASNVSYLQSIEVAFEATA